MAKKNKYNMTAVVNRVVTDSIDFTVEATTKAKAFEYSEKFLQTYPGPVEKDLGVSYAFVTDRENHKTQIVTLDEDKSVA